MVDIERRVRTLKKEQNLDRLRKNVEQHERERNPEDFEPSFKPDTKKS